MSVMFADSDPEATCKVCQSLAVDGTLEKLRLPKVQKGANNSGNPRYTEMQRAFAAHPEVTTNPKKAAVDAGYSKAYAKSHAHALREQLAPLIMDLQELARKKSAISKARVQTELASMGFANIIDYFEIDEETGAVIPKKMNELTREQAAAIQEVEVAEYETPDGIEFRIKKLKLADKRANLVELGKTLGMFNKFTIEDKRQETMALNDIPTEALEEAESLLLAAVSQARDQKAKNNAIEGEVLPPPGAVESEEPI